MTSSIEWLSCVFCPQSWMPSSQNGFSGLRVSFNITAVSGSRWISCTCATRHGGRPEKRDENSAQKWWLRTFCYLVWIVKWTNNNSFNIPGPLISQQWMTVLIQRTVSIRSRRLLMSEYEQIDDRNIWSVVSCKVKQLRFGNRRGRRSEG